jgi:tetratricopeptide (TPR) repeat protein
MRRLQLVSLGSLSRMIKSADESWERGDSQQCFEMLERASRLDPGNPKMQFYLGQLFGLRYNYTAAGRCFEQAVRIAPDKTEALEIAGRLSLDFGRHQMAEDYFRRAVEQNNTSAETFARLAELYERLNRIEDSSRLVDQALLLDDNCALAQLTRAKLYRQTHRLEGAEQLLRSFLATNNPINTNDRSLQIRCHYELGGILDRQGRYDEAMTAFLEAKKLVTPETEHDFALMKDFRARFETMQASLTVEMLQRWRDTASAFQPSRRLALLCGHARSGTTLLEQVLDSHPDIISVEEKDFFTKNAYATLKRGFPPEAHIVPILEAAPISALQQSRESYFHFVELFLNQPVGSRLLIDKNPAFNHFIPAYIRIFPEIKFLVALRDPRDVCMSCFMQYFSGRGMINYAFTSLERTVEDYVSRIGIWQTVKPLIKNPWIEVRYEDIVNDLESVSRRTLDFLGVPWDKRVLRFDEHARQKVVRSPTYADVIKPVYKSAIGRWRNYQKYLEPCLDKLEPFVKAFGYE